MKCRSLIFFACFVAYLSLMFPSNAHAYLDPGVGSYILQALIAGFFGALFTIKVYWERIKLFFAGSRTNGEKDEQK